MKSINKLVGNVFKPPIKKYYFGPLRYGTPYFWPMNFCASIIKIRKLKLTSQEELDKCTNDYQRQNKKFSNMPMIRRTKSFTPKVFGNYYYIQIGWPIMFSKTDLGWKDKFESPRFEWGPSFIIFFFGLQFCIFWKAPIEDEDRYWEMVLWYNNYADQDIVKASSTWGWVDYETKLSTWDITALK